MKKLFFTLLAAGFGLLAQAQPPAGDAKPGDFYGEKITSTDGALNVVDVAAKLSGGTESFNTKMQGKVVDVCPKKGCWITLDIGNGQTATVKMKDYGFFVPLALIGKTVVVDGEAKMKTTSVAELKHYAEDAKKSQAEIDAITEPKQEVRIMAKGIVVVQ